MKRFEDYLNVILKQEGGDKYHEVEGDPGGATKYGISLRFYRTIKPDATKDDIRNLTYPEASDIYKKYFYNAAHLDSIENELLRLHVFSHGVNRGMPKAIKLLQKIVGAEPDGKLGKTTAMMVNSEKDQPALVQGYAAARKVDYENIVANNPNLKKFLIGWFNRVNTTKF